MIANWKLCGWVDGGSQRSAIIRAMEIPLIPTKICKKSRQFNKKISLNNTSGVLKEFKKKGIAVCLNEESKIGRIYQLTELGKEIRDEIIRVYSTLQE